jgi:DNA mismatch repair protein MutS
MGISPMMQQYLDIKEKNPDSIIFFRLGDFYEMFYEQAELCSRELELTLTGKDCGEEKRAPMCGIPFHSVDSYIAKLVEKGYKVAICEQVEDPKQAKGLVKRDVVKIITPGTIIENQMLDEKANNYIANIFNLGRSYAISYTDISTGECYVTKTDEINGMYKVVDEVLKLRPKELVLEDSILSNNYIMENVVKRAGIYVSRYLKQDTEYINQMGLLNAQKFDLVEEKSLTLLLNYILDTQKNNSSQINKIIKYDLTAYMRLDVNTRRNLEITESNMEKTKKGSLLWVLDKTTTAMGSRKMKHWIENPLLDKNAIEDRLNAVEILKNDLFNRKELVSMLSEVRDAQRLSTKMVNAGVNARDMIALKNSFRVLPRIREIFSEVINLSNLKDKKYITRLRDSIDELQDVYSLIDASISEEPPILITEGGIIKPGYNADVDEYRRASTDGKNWILQLEAKEREETGIKGLKIGFNNVFGYYIEITKSNFKDIPEGRYVRKQTLADKERFITPELKEMENKILGSQEKLVALEYKLFTEIREKVSLELVRIQQTADAIATLDVLCALAQVAEDNNYVRPEMSYNDEIEIVEGRHPVVERTIKDGNFIPNDTYLNNSDSCFHIITGPNMAGKSTYMRQVAVLTYMAQIGSFVPASNAKIGIVDRIFTRVGASDDLAAGESTFMVEMNELANILENATSRSLVILDEIGRGTSTYDGMAIAWATVEYIANKEKIGAKTLFATHYHELEQLEDKIEGVKNFSVAVKEKGEDVIFLRKIIPEPADESYGIYVAKLAGVPNIVVNRAKQILKDLEKDMTFKKAKSNDVKVITDSLQVDMFNYKLAEIGHMLDKIVLDELTAKDALDVLYKLKDKMNG